MLRITNVTNDNLAYCRAIYICKYIADFLLKKICFLIFICLLSADCDIDYSSGKHYVKYWRVYIKYIVSIFMNIKTIQGY